ncbi:PH domain-containing protein [Winogradskyella psychrotolerans]|uniref:PH domain-containing protein n=1 Tax=Winogradskyella psychrotolerans TaxID=1344585 RepID=UPI001C07B504|nr:PH domain-containing protein [Winogradskyella psychrotolerans]MBU2921336.1 PH domain-containing protein [Winogradskyella psychrotolerans]
MNFTNLQIQTEQLPKVEDVVLKPISKSYLKIILLNKLALYIGVIGLVFGLKYIIEKKEELQLNLWYMLSAVVVFCVFNFIVSLLAFKKRKYAMREHDVVYAKGLLVHSITTVPISRIQHVEESRSWLARHFGLATLKIFTAGEAGSDLSIKGLPYIEAKQIKEIISDKVNGNN